MLFYSCSSLTYFLTQWFPPIKRLSCFLYFEGLHDHSRKPVPCNNSNLIKFGIHEYYVGLLSYIGLCMCLCKTESTTGMEKEKNVFPSKVVYIQYFSPFTDCVQIELQYPRIYQYTAQWQCSCTYRMLHWSKLWPPRISVMTRFHCHWWNQDKLLCIYSTFQRK